MPPYYYPAPTQPGDNYDPDLPARERSLSPKDRTLNVLLNYNNWFAKARAGAEAMNRGESFWGGTPRYDAELAALQRYYGAAAETQPDSMKVLHTVIPLGLTPWRRAAAAFGLVPPETSPPETSPAPVDPEKILEFLARTWQVPSSSGTPDADQVVPKSPPPPQPAPFGFGSAGNWDDRPLSSGAGTRWLPRLPQPIPDPHKSLSW